MITHSALVFVDWDSARRVANRGKVATRRKPEREIEEAIDALQDEVATILPKGDIYRVSWRLYHGWHEGTTRTTDRKLMDEFVIRYSPRTIRRISFGGDFAFGDQMLCSSGRMPLRHTLRRRTVGHKFVYDQKMVDTALVADLLHAARTKDHDYLVVIGDDDDLLPGLLAAEAWGATIRLLRVNNTSGLPLLPERSKGFPVSMTRRRET